MNEHQKEAAKYAEILLAFSRGEKLQYNTLPPREGVWCAVAEGHCFDHRLFQYRIAQKPVERFAVVNDCGDIVNHFQTTERAERYQASLAAQTRIVHLREVTP